ncbi:hypothetical protein BDQ12DRAFT_725710 [Crucibulum laeve]|uniref:Uncharacterized protein n=1 Tax=Crucibulum laeve TaxID=68775 RepID=A0A5C3LTM2_9AGAR|nr:hypothetical protein BDQ12DRAFT_725710 [Crucibulum laeve]
MDENPGRDPETPCQTPLKHDPSAPSHLLLSPFILPLGQWSPPVYIHGSPVPVVYYPTYMFAPVTPHATTHATPVHTSQQLCTPVELDGDSDWDSELELDQGGEPVKKGGQSKKKSNQDKLEEILALLQQFHWSIGDFLLHLFLPQLHQISAKIRFL